MDGHCASCCCNPPATRRAQGAHAAVRAPPPLTDFSFIELFAGVGGFRVALEAIGGQCVWSCEKDYAARAVYAANHDGQPPYADVREADPKFVPPFRVLTAGFPCQDFSTLGEQAGLEGSRGSLFFEIIRFMRSHEPDAVFLENVRGLVTMNGGAAFRAVLEALEAEGYVVKHSLVNSQVLVPQYRNRVYIVAFRDATAGARFAFPKLPLLEAPPLVTEPRGRGTTPAKNMQERRMRRKREEQAQAAAALIESDGEDEEAAPTTGAGASAGGGAGAKWTAPRKHKQKARPRHRSMAEILEPVEDPFLAHQYILAPQQWKRVRASTTVKRYGLPGRLVTLNGVADTLLASYRSSAHSFAQFVPLYDAPVCLAATKDSKAAAEGTVTKEMTERVTGGGGKERVRPRWFTPRECHRIMGFPEHFRIHPNPTHAYHQMGNAVTPPIVALLCGHLMAALQTDPATAQRHVAASYSAAVTLAAASTPSGGRRRALLMRRVTVEAGEAGTCAEGFGAFDGAAWQLIAAGDSPLARHLTCVSEAMGTNPDGTRPFPVCSCLLKADHVWRYGCFSGSPVHKGRRKQPPVPQARCTWCQRGPNMAVEGVTVVTTPQLSDAGATRSSHVAATSSGAAAARAGVSPAVRNATVAAVVAVGCVVAAALGSGWLRVRRAR